MRSHEKDPFIVTFGYISCDRKISGIYRKRNREGNGFFLFEDLLAIMKKVLTDLLTPVLTHEEIDAYVSAIKRLFSKRGDVKTGERGFNESE